jgi:NhaP-type Na+/H+ or K+/H+ antiporter
MKSRVFPYLVAIVSLGLVGVVSHFAPELFRFFEHNPEHGLLSIFFEIGVLFVLSFIIFYVSHTTSLPSFVVAIFFGVAAQSVLKPIVQEQEVLAALVGFGATLILFGGGLETPFVNFKKLLWKILSLSFPGLLITAVLFSLTAYTLGSLLGTPISIVVAVLLGAVLASTDPAAIIPILKKLRFHNRSTKDIIISESAVTDVTGTLLTVVFLAMITGGVLFSSITDWYKSIFSTQTGLVLLKQLFFGILLGVLGYFFLELLKKFKKNHDREFEADSAFFLFIPVIIFTIALSLGGSGYLAAFIAGLLFNLTEHLHETERFFNHMIDGFFKPAIFMLLGSLVDLSQLVGYAGVGILVAVIFMFVIRPITVFATLGPFSLFGKDRLSWRELLFVSFVRETGAIPAVLLVTIMSMKLAGMDGLVAIGMWVILLTLIIEPLLTPFVARFLKVAEPITEESQITLHQEGAVAVLGTRGRSFITRLPFVAEWAVKHGMKQLVVLLCLEEKYSPELEKEMKEVAEEEFKKLETSLRDRSAVLQLSFVSRQGLLHETIKNMANENTAVTTIFVGRKMLDFNLADIKKLGVPLYFVE